MPAIDLGLPIRPFLYTLDQISDLIVVGLKPLRANYIFFDGVSTGTRGKDRMLAINIAAEGRNPDWRVAEEELKRWLRHKGFRVYDTSRLRF